MKGYSLIAPHWQPVFWYLFWNERPFEVTFVETDNIDGYSAFGWWYPKLTTNQESKTK